MAVADRWLGGFRGLAGKELWVRYVQNLWFSPSGNYLVGTRRPAANTSLDEPIVWRMPAGSQRFTPVVLMIGISNSENPVIAGNSALPARQYRATVWSVTGAATDLGAMGGTLCD